MDRDRQIEREQAQRDAATGRRLGSIREGHLGPAIKRWVNADIRPIAALLREAAQLYLNADLEGFAQALDTPTMELTGTERPLGSLFVWCLRGHSPGRAGSIGETTHADDLVLAFMAGAISRCATGSSREGGDGAPTIAAVLAGGADVLRDTALGQFVVSIQGASAMQAVRERNPELWQQKKSLNRVCATLASQVRPQLLEEERGERVLRMRGSRKVVSVTQGGKERRIELRPPDAIDWEIMSLCWKPEGAGASTHHSLWLGFAGVFLAAAQKVGGWFDTMDRKQRHGKHVRTSKLLVLSDRAHRAIKRDADRWVEAGFDAEPMVVPPEDGDYLTVKHRKVTGQRAPLGMTTNPQETTPWLTGVAALAATPWTVNPYALTEPVEETSANDLLKLAAHRRLAGETFYLPTTMDFRGRVYYRPSRVTPQSGDLGKSLLCFPSDNRLITSEQQSLLIDSLAMHLSGLYGGPQKLDKAPLHMRLAWLHSLTEESLQATLAQADKPRTLAAHLELMGHEETDSIPVQLDGTCNGLQHLSAMFRDEEGARHVNLTRSGLEKAPADIYGHVAWRANMAWGRDLVMDPQGWMRRMKAAGIEIDRSLCKSPVMVLPYGGTREAVRISVKASLVERLHSLDPQQCPWRSYTDEGYGAFSARPLQDHPLFNKDAGQLGELIWSAISPAIPRAMAAMQTLQAIGSWVGERGLSWRVGGGPEEKRLWVTQAKSKAQRKQVAMRGFHLPQMVRRLTLNVGQNEIDPKAHRTGIVANFIHSQDAAHLSASVALFRERGGGCVGSVHDCVMVRPSEAALMGTCLREAFVALYTVGGSSEDGPLGQPVRLISPDGTVEEFADWHHLAAAAGTVFPERGCFDVREVLDSAWFFS